MNNGVENFNNMQNGSYFVKYQGDGGSKWLWTWRKVDPNESFGTFKEKILTTEIANDERSTLRYDLLSVKIHYFSLLRSNKIPFEPRDCDNILEVVAREECHWPGTVVICASHRYRDFPLFLVRSGEDESSVPQLLSTSLRVERSLVCTDWATSSLTPNAVDGPIPWETQLSYICSRSKFYGSLQKRVSIDGKGDVWKDVFCVLQEHMIWFTNLRTWESEKHFTYIPLSAEAISKITNESIGTFVVNLSGANVDSEKDIVLKSKSISATALWVSSINSRAFTENSDDLMAALDQNISSDMFCQAISSLDENSRSCVEYAIPLNGDLNAIAHVAVAAAANPHAVGNNNLSLEHPTRMHFSHSSLSASTVFTDPRVEIVSSGLMKCNYRPQQPLQQQSSSSLFNGASGAIGRMTSMSSVGSTAVSSSSLSSSSRPQNKMNTKPNNGSLLSEDLNGTINPAARVIRGSFPITRSSADSDTKIASTSSTSSGVDGIPQWCMLVRVCGQGMLLLCDPSTPFALTAYVELALVDKV